MNTIDWSLRAKDAHLSVRHVINGNTIDCVDTANQTIEKYSPRDGQLLYQFSASSVEVVEQAVQNARTALDDGRWSALPVQERKTVLQTWADLLEKHKEEMALYDTLDVGKPIAKALTQDIPLTISTLRQCAENVDKLLTHAGTDGGTLAFQRRKPVGVVGSIIGWNFPLWMAAIKAGPALATGNSLILKPSEFTPLSAIRFAELGMEAGLPPGVFNVIQGSGSSVGAALAHHPSVNLLSFTGSSATGKKMLIAAGQSNMKRLMLECGGKSPYLVFDDCPSDLDFIAADVVETAFHNQGEWCSAGSRLLIHESIKDQILPKILEQAALIKLKDPLNPETTFGALINESHLHKVLGYVESGKQDGAKLVLGGQRTYVETGGEGYYLEPTIFEQVKPQHRIAREEIYGPVLSVLTFKDEAEAIHLANNTCYGLAAYAATENLGRMQRLSQHLNAGHLIIVGSSNPAGGAVDLSGEPQKESDFGNEIGLAGLASYTVSTSVHLLT